MRKTHASRRSAGILLLILFAVSGILRTGHVFWCHTDRDQHPVCEAAWQGDNKHFHDERYGAGDDCPFCAFLFSVPGIVVHPKLTLPELKFPVPTLLAATDLVYPTTILDGFFLRGPPPSDKFFS